MPTCDPQRIRRLSGNDCFKRVMAMSLIRTSCKCFVFLMALSWDCPNQVWAEPPTAAYIFPAGGQRGTSVNVRIGGHFFHDKADFLLLGSGVTANSTIERISTLWFEGPFVALPASQQKEDYPKDYANRIEIAHDAPVGVRFWYATTSQGITPAERFVVGSFPEVIEDEAPRAEEPRIEQPDPSKPADPNKLADGSRVTLPVTINGRIFPREDVDTWTFAAKAGQIVTCEVNAARLGSGLDSRIEVLDPRGRIIAENSDSLGLDSFVRFTALEEGNYSVRIHDIRFDGLQHFVYRLTITAGAWLDRVYPLGGRRGSTVSLQLAGANLPSDRFDFAVPQDNAIAGGTSFLKSASELRGKEFLDRLAVLRRMGTIEFTSLRIPTASGETNSCVFEIDDVPEHLEAEPNDQSAQAAKFEWSSVLNGRIDHPGDVDYWSFAGNKGEQWQFDLRASRLGSDLDGVLTLLDEKGAVVVQADDLGSGQTDCILSAQLPTDGIYTLKVEDGLGSRGGLSFAYRVRVGTPTLSVESLAKRGGPEALPKVSESERVKLFSLTLSSDAITLPRGGEVRVKLLAERTDFPDDVAIRVEGLPEGVTVANDLKLGKGQKQMEFVLKADTTAKITTSQLRVVGSWKRRDEEQTTVAMVQRPLGESPSVDLLLRVGVPTPFKLKGIFESKYASRGSVFTRKFKVERNGFTGPIFAEIADRQARHLQGVTGPRMTIPADVDEFEYPFSLPPWMEIGRTSRSCVAVFGELTDSDGSKHTVSHTSQNQDDQAIVIIEPNRLSLETTQPTVRRISGGEAHIPIRVSRGFGLRGVVRIECLTPSQSFGLQTDPIEVADGANNGDVTLRFDAVTKSSTNAVLKFRATILDGRDLPVVDELDVRVVDAP